MEDPENLAAKLLAGPEPRQIVVDDALSSRGGGETRVEVGEKQSDSFRDVGAALVFLAHLAILVYMALVHGIRSLTFDAPSYGSTERLYFGGTFVVFILATLVALGLTAALVAILTRYVEQLVQLAFIFTIGSTTLLIFAFVGQQYWTGVVLSSIVLIWGVLYARSVWNRIPFAAANLQVALSAVQSNGGIVLVAYGMVLVVCLYTIVWILAWLGAYVMSAKCEQGACNYHMNPFVLLFFLLSFYWTSSVCINILHVTVSGVVGTWWFAPHDASSFWSPCIVDSLTRASTYSLGSICLGSLLTAILQLLYQLARTASHHRHFSFILCILQCMLGFLERMVSYFNQYAYVYIGLYGYDFLTSGHKTAMLFVARGWTVILNDDLVHRVLTLAGLVVGVACGAVGVALSTLHPSWTEDYGSSQTAISFLLPFLIGTTVANIVMATVASAVNTILVAFAEAPLDLERNHPGLHRQMIAAWHQVYPNSVAI